MPPIIRSLSAVPQKALESGILIVTVAWIEDWQQSKLSKELRFLR